MFACQPGERFGLHVRGERDPPGGWRLAPPHPPLKPTPPLPTTSTDVREKLLLSKIIGLLHPAISPGPQWKRAYNFPIVIRCRFRSSLIKRSTDARQNGRSPFPASASELFGDEGRTRPANISHPPLHPPPPPAPSPTPVKKERNIRQQKHARLPKLQVVVCEIVAMHTTLHQNQKQKIIIKWKWGIFQENHIFALGVSETWNVSFTPSSNHESGCFHTLSSPLHFPHVMPTHSQVWLACGINVGPDCIYSLSLNATSTIPCCPSPLYWELPTWIATFFRNKKIDPWTHKTSFSFHYFHKYTNFVFGLFYLPRISSRCFWKQVCLFVFWEFFFFFFLDLNLKRMESTIAKDSWIKLESFSGLWRFCWDIQAFSHKSTSLEEWRLKAKATFPFLQLWALNLKASHPKVWTA